MNIKYSRRLITPYGVALRDTGGDISIIPSTRIPFIYDASKPIKVVRNKKLSFVGSSFDRINSNYAISAATITLPVIDSSKPISATPVTLPVVAPSKPPTPPFKPPTLAPIGGGAGGVKPCQPRPACLDATPRCSIAAPAGGWCPKEEKPPTPEKKELGIGINLLAYGAGIIIGGSGGYYLAKKNNKNILGGIVLGGAIGSGLVWVILNRQYLMERLKMAAGKRGRVENK